MNRTLAGTLIAVVSLAGLSRGVAEAQLTASQVQAAPPASYFAGPWPKEDLTPEWMDVLLAPIALYPDPLLAQVLPASTYPVELVRAKRLIDKQAPVEEIDATDLDVSVKALARYPDVVRLMDEHIEWTERLGQAFLDQQDDVMRSVQRLRVQAQTIGNLASTQQQSVYYESEFIRIVPVTEYIYVPTYEPAIVYSTACPTYYNTGYITYSTGCAIGSWLSYDCDWRNRRICRPCNWSWLDYCRRPRHRDGEHFAAAPNGPRDERLVRPEPTAITPDQPWRRDADKPSPPGGRPRDRVRGTPTTPPITAAPPTRVIPPSEMQPPTPTPLPRTDSPRRADPPREAPRSAEPATRVQPPMPRSTTGSALPQARKEPMASVTPFARRMESPTLVAPEPTPIAKPRAESGNADPKPRAKPTPTSPVAPPSPDRKPAISGGKDRPTLKPPTLTASPAPALPRIATPPPPAASPRPSEPPPAAPRPVSKPTPQPTITAVRPSPTAPSPKVGAPPQPPPKPVVKTPDPPKPAPSPSASDDRSSGGRRDRK